MPTVTDTIKNKLKETEEQLAAALHSPSENELTEETYWLEQALQSVTPQEVVNRAHSLYKETQGKRGLPPDVLNGGTKQKEPVALSSASNAITVRPGDSLWGILYRAFASEDQLDDPHFANMFRRLPPAAQSHFVDAVEDHIRSLVAEEQRARKNTNSFGIVNTDQLSPNASLRLDSILRNEELLLQLIHKAKEIASVKEELLHQCAKKAADWLQYHQTEPHTESKFEEVLYGPSAAGAFIELPSDEIQALLAKAKHSTLLSQHEEDTLAAYLPPYERKIRDRFTMSASEYIRMRSIVVEKLLDAVPLDEKQLSVIVKSAVRLELLDVPEEEFYKRVRVAQLMRAYTFGKDIRSITVRQFFRGIVENT